jgi:hypothetical protein
VAFLIGYAVLLVADTSGVQAEASQQNKHTEATNNEHLNPCERIDKVARLESRPFTREEIRIRDSGICNQGHDVFTTPPGNATTSASASPVPVPPTGGPAILLPAAALLLGSGILAYAILSRR